MRRATLLLVAMLLGSARAGAHGLSTSYTEITVSPSRVEVVCLMTVEDIVAHFPVSLDKTGRITPEALQDVAPAIFAFLGQHLTLALDESNVVLEAGSHRDHAGGTFVRFQFSRPLETRPSVLGLAADVEFFERLGPQHTNFVRFAADGRSQPAVITLDRSRAVFSTGYRPRLEQCLAFIRLGIGHIFLGYDHVVFLVALIVVGGRLAQLVKIVTAFTVAHSLTLVLATLQIVTLPARLVEGTIALTIAYVAFDNFFVAGTAHRPLLTFCFGLVHGFGFAHALQEMDLPRSELVPTLVSFNLGVEVGQLAILALLFPVTLWLARQRFSQLVVATTSGAAFLCGVGWFVQRVFDLSFMPI